MSSFIFDAFKKRFLEGKVPQKDTWYFLPVNDTFQSRMEVSGIRLDQFRTLDDFKGVSDYQNRIDKKTNSLKNKDFDFTYADNIIDIKFSGDCLVNGKKMDYKWTKVIDDGTEFTNKPMFVTNENFDTFNSYYSACIANNQYIRDYLNSGGFYYIRSKDELAWFSERTKENNRIIGVLGDPIEGIINSEPIGVNEEYPFEGILDGNYYNLDICIDASYTDNGIIGVLGKQGIVRNIKLIHTDENKNLNTINCTKTINLKHIKEDGRDINCGLLVGRNYGTIQNVDATELQTFYLSGFVPSVYSVTNKSDNYRWNETDTIVRQKYDEANENFYLLNSFCINSPGNICPYIGYFAEGYFCNDGAALALDSNIYLSAKTNTPTFKDPRTFINNENLSWQQNTIKITNSGIDYCPLGTYISDGSINNYALFVSGTCHPNNIESISENAMNYVKNPLYYGLDYYGTYTVRNIGYYYFDIQQIPTPYSFDLKKATINYNTNLIVKSFGGENGLSGGKYNPSYEPTRCSLRMHPQARVAYNIGVIVGANYGSISFVNVKAEIKNTSNFVGFIGGLVGKQSNGNIESVGISAIYNLNYDFNNIPSAGGMVVYKNTPIFPPNVFKSKIENTSAFDEYANKLDIINQYNKWYCTPWYNDEFNAYDGGDNTTVDVTRVITNDCTTYEMRPIFVVGGLIGRYIPTFGCTTNNNHEDIGMECTINNTNVIYSDNNSDITTEKRFENAFGCVIGKVDYDIQTDSYLYKPAMSISNCKFNAKKQVGDSMRVYSYTYNELAGGFVPVTEPIEDEESEEQRYRLLSADSTARMVGIYELKYNILNSVTYNASNIGTFAELSGYEKYDPEKAPTLPTEMEDRKSLTEYNIFWASDYPFDLSSHKAGILKTHNMTDYVDWGSIPPQIEKQYTDDKMNWGSTIKKSYYWDYNHTAFLNPIYDFSTNATANYGGCPIGGYNKINMACKLINVMNSTSNLDAWIQIYDDYISTYDFMKLPSIYSYRGNSFTQEDINTIQEAWNKYKVNNDNSDLNPYCINPYVMHGTQNAFDGYTTISYDHISAHYNETLTAYPDSPCTLYRQYSDGDYTNSAYKIDEVNTYISKINDKGKLEETYHLTRIYKKNIVPSINMNFVTAPMSTETDVSTLINPNNVFMPPRQTEDNYYYYTYSASAGEMNNIHNRAVPFVSAFGWSKEVEFVKSVNDGLGYSATDGNYIGIGENLEPINIRQRINHSELYDEKGNKYFISTSISSNENLGGVLVFDKDKNNIMYLDNENEAPLTGNSVIFNLNPDKEDKYIIKV